MADNETWRIDAELQPGERLLWKGRPDADVRLRSSDGCAIPFSILFALVAVGIAIAAFSGNMHWKGSDDPIPRILQFAVAGLFVLAALHVTVGRFFADAHSRRWYEYALTDRRAIILSGKGKPNVRSVDYLALPSVTFDEDEDGFGTIYFQGRSTLFDDLLIKRAIAHSSTDAIVGFDMIGNVKDVFRLILEARKERSAVSAESSPSPR